MSHSDGRFLGATTTDFSLDAEGAFKHLLKRSEVRKAGILGHSEGANVKCPVLVLNGDLDLQVVADLNVPAIEAALHKGGNGRVTVKRFPNLNHLFQTANTGLPSEYPQIDETIAPELLSTIANWHADRSCA